MNDPDGLYSLMSMFAGYTSLVVPMMAPPCLGYVLPPPELWYNGPESRSNGPGSRPNTTTRHRPKSASIAGDGGHRTKKVERKRGKKVGQDAGEMGAREEIEHSMMEGYCTVGSMRWIFSKEKKMAKRKVGKGREQDTSKKNSSRSSRWLSRWILLPDYFFTSPAPPSQTSEDGCSQETSFPSLENHGNNPLSRRQLQQSPQYENSQFCTEPHLQPPPTPTDEKRYSYTTLELSPTPTYTSIGIKNRDENILDEYDEDLKISWRLSKRHKVRCTRLLRLLKFTRRNDARSHKEGKSKYL